MNINPVWAQSPPPGIWARDAECQSYSELADAFTEVSNFSDASLGLSICSDCPVQLACLRYGQELRADGVWGGRLLREGRIRQRHRRYATFTVESMSATQVRHAQAVD